MYYAVFFFSTASLYFWEGLVSGVGIWAACEGWERVGKGAFMVFEARRGEWGRMAVRVVWSAFSRVWKLKGSPVHTIKAECLITHNIETDHRSSAIASAVAVLAVASREKGASPMASKTPGKWGSSADLDANSGRDALSLEAPTRRRSHRDMPPKPRSRRTGKAGNRWKR